MDRRCLCVIIRVSGRLLRPRDMEMSEDCSCGDTVDSAAEEAAANALDTEVLLAKAGISA
ncbi:hypothetical protein PsorP6_006618 [Peronosclerospora sorghi]|uniref:Uncharacterized protein n=1 Tax=Peronosclerospora sorghi TaxID=230839 RepID=A0ACC0W5C6_9STRA|nr:hypothetical protein PsorP6_006618 [Peronosclerospora sorghi]